VSAKGGEETLLTEEGENRYPVVSPDGEKILFCSNRDGTGGDLYLMNADGSKPRRLTTTGKICDFAWNL
jgi:tricorn protease